MSTRLFSSLERRISPNAPGCPLPVIVQYVRDAAIEACRRSLAYRFEQEEYPLTAGVYDYEFELPNNTEVVAVLSSAINDQRAPFVTLAEAHARYPNWPSDDTADRSAPAIFTQVAGFKFYVAPTPDAATTYNAKMFLALKPTRDATGMEEETFNMLEEAMMHGALYRLHSLPERSWTDADLATYHNRQFVYHSNTLRAAANHTVGMASLTVQAVPFGA